MGIQIDTVEPCSFPEFCGDMESSTFDEESFNTRKVSKREILSKEQDAISPHVFKL